jgi:hypothetical protein
VLERAGLIVRGHEAQWRPCRIEPQALKGVDDWLETYRKLWSERLDRLEAYLIELQAKEAEPQPAKPSKRRTGESKRERRK